MYNLAHKDESVHINSEIINRQKAIKEAKAKLKDLRQNGDMMARAHFRPGMGLFPVFKKDFLRLAKRALEAQIRADTLEIHRLAKQDGVEPDLFDLAQMRTEDRKIAKRLIAYQSDRPLQIGKKEIPANEYAQKRGYAILGCSTLLIRRETDDKGETMYRNRCGNPFCRTCAHYESRKLTNLISQNILKKIVQIPQNELVRGRLVHIVLTAENTALENTFDTVKAWRKLQNAKMRGDADSDVWTHATWGMYRAETTHNKVTDTWHGHLHIVAWVDGYLVDNRQRIRYGAKDWRKNAVKLRKPLKIPEKRKKAGWWLTMQRAWKKACAKVGLNAAVNFSRQVNGAKVQHVGLILSGKEVITSGYDPEKITSAVAEAAKYAVKHTDLDGLSVGNIVDLMAVRHGKRLMAAWGGLNIRGLDETEEEKEIKQAARDKEDYEGKALEVVYRFNRLSQKYEPINARIWTEQSERDIRELATTFGREGGEAHAVYGVYW